MDVGTQRPDFAEFYRGSRDDCLRTVLVSVGNRDTAQDLVDEAFARACASWRTVSRHPPGPAARAARPAARWAGYVSDKVNVARAEPGFEDAPG